MREIEHLEDITIANTQQLLDPDGTLKHEVVFIGGFLAYKHQNGHAEDEADDDVVSSEFIQEWDQGGLNILLYSLFTLLSTSLKPF